jgi:hypothetical protein
MAAGRERIGLSEQGFGDLAVPSTRPVCFQVFVRGDLFACAHKRRGRGTF